MAQRFSAALGPGPDPGAWDRVPRQAPCTEPASPSACVSASLSLSVTIINKLKKKKKIFVLFFKDFVYLFERETVREHKWE